MALSKTRLATNIISALDAAGAYDNIPAADRPAAKADSEAKIRAITDAIIDELTAHAEVSTTVASGIAVATTGTAAAQTGATTATGTGSGGIA